MWKKWVIDCDINQGWPPTMCPVDEKDGSIITGMMLVSTEPINGELIGLWGTKENVENYIKSNENHLREHPNSEHFRKWYSDEGVSEV